MNQVHSPVVKDSITILPVSQGKGETYKEQLVPKFGKFVQWIEEITGAKSDAEWVIMGHGGAYEPIGEILERQASNPSFIKRVKGVGLLNAAYSKLPSYRAKLKKAVAANSSLKIHSVYHPKSATEEGSKTLASSLGSKHVRLYEYKDKDTCNIPKKRFKEVLENITAGWTEKGEGGSEGSSANTIAN